MIRPPNPFRLVKLNDCSEPPQRLRVFATFFVQGGLNHGGIVKVNSVIWGLCKWRQFSVENILSSDPQECKSRFLSRNIVARQKTTEDNSQRGRK